MKRYFVYGLASAFLLLAGCASVGTTSTPAPVAEATSPQATPPIHEHPAARDAGADQSGAGR